MNLFNSLGSNYDLRFVIKALTSGNNYCYLSRLRSYLENKYEGKTVLVYKGRQALELTLRMLSLPSGSSIAINGFTCYTVYKAIVNAGHKPRYLDINRKSLNFSPDTLRSKLRKNPNIKAVIVQNTLGYPCDIEKIVKICKDHKIFLIEDLAHSVGTIYKNGKEGGTVGDFTVLSFSQDKILDGVSGGALIIRNKDYYKKKIPKLEKVASRQQLVDRFYPLLTYIIRTTYKVGFGKLIHATLKKINLLSNPMGNKNVDKISKLPNWYANLIYKCFQDLQDNLSHRKEVAFVYANKINPDILLKSVIKDIPYSTNLRFPIFVDNRTALIKYLRKDKVYVSDIWYDAPVAPKKYMNLTDYKDQCPCSEMVSNRILNLPTHQNVSKKQAEEISERINQWLKLH